MSLIDVQMSACNPIINYSFAEGSHYTHCNGDKLKKEKNQVNKDETIRTFAYKSLKVTQHTENKVADN